jgi:DNA-binding MarR family transcriptional regulator
LPLKEFAPSSAEEAVLVTLLQVGRRMRQRHAEDDIDPAAMPLLHVLRCTGPMRLSDLAGRLRLDASTVSRHVRQLQQRGLVERSHDPDDRRASQVRLAPDGEKALTAAMERRRESFAEVLSTWSPADRDRLRELLSRFAADVASANDRDDQLSTTEEGP